MQRDCLMKIDETCAALTEKHKAEVGTTDLQLIVYAQFNSIKVHHWIRQIS